MPQKIITIYCLVDELLKAIGFQDDPQAKLTTAEILTIALVAAEFFTGNHQASLAFLTSHGYIQPFSKSRFNRRLHALPEGIWQMLVWTLAQIHQQTNPDAIHLVDTFPVPVCHNIRIRRCRIYQQRAFRGYCASKKQYYFGLKVCLVITKQGAPVELLLVPASTNDLSALRSMELDLPEGSTLIGDGGFLDRGLEARLLGAG